MKIRAIYEDGHTEVSEHINALYADKYVKSNSSIKNYEIVSGKWDGETFNNQEIETYAYQF